MEREERKERARLAREKAREKKLFRLAERPRPSPGVPRHPADGFKMYQERKAARAARKLDAIARDFSGEDSVSGEDDERGFSGK